MKAERGCCAVFEVNGKPRRCGRPVLVWRHRLCRAHVQQFYKAGEAWQPQPPRLMRPPYQPKEGVK